MKGLPWGAALSIVSAVVYGLSPIDIIPDFIAVIGWVDDAFVVPLLLLYAWILWKRHRKMKKEAAIPVKQAGGRRPSLR